MPVMNFSELKALVKPLFVSNFTLFLPYFHYPACLRNSFSCKWLETMNIICLPCSYNLHYKFALVHHQTPSQDNLLSDLV